MRKAYRQKVLETHPDKLGPDASEQEKQEAEDQFRNVGVTNPDPIMFVPLKVLLLLGAGSFRSTREC